MKIENIIEEGRRLSEISDYAELKSSYELWCGRVKEILIKEGISKENFREIQVKMYYEENEYSKEDTKKAILKAVKNTLSFLEQIKKYIKREMPKETALVLIKQILNNFYMHYKAMYRSPVHRGGTLKQETIDAIKIGNEYDLQRMLYSLLLPIFPTLRQEVNSDNGYGGMRADIYLEEYNLIIETKCTRNSMSEKKLAEELGADGFHYKADVLFFLIYDKNVIIKNPEAFKSAFKRNQEKNKKTIEVFILQPIEF